MATASRVASFSEMHHSLAGRVTPRPTYRGLDRMPADQHGGEPMPSGKLAGVDEHPTMFSTVVIGCDSFNNAGAPALFKALAYVTVGHWEFFQDVSAQRLI